MVFVLRHDGSGLTDVFKGETEKEALALLHRCHYRKYYRIVSSNNPKAWVTMYGELREPK